jgi:hypothetical protein
LLEEELDKFYSKHGIADGTMKLFTLGCGVFGLSASAFCQFTGRAAPFMQTHPLVGCIPLVQRILHKLCTLPGLPAHKFSILRQ